MSHCLRELRIARGPYLYGNGLDFLLSSFAARRDRVTERASGTLRANYDVAIGLFNPLVDALQDALL